MGKISDLLVDPHNASELMMKDAEKELILGYRDYTLPRYQFGTADPIELKVRIIHPNQEIDVLVAESYTVKFNDLLKNSGLMTWEEMKPNLHKRGIWTEEDDKRYITQDSLIRDCATKVAMFARSNKLDKKKRSKAEEAKFQSAKGEFDTLNTEIELLNMRRFEFYMQTIEGQSNQYAQYEKLIHCVLVEKDKWIRLWESVKELNNETPYNREAITRLSTVAMAFWSGMAQEILDYLPDSSGIGEEIAKITSSES